jgi:hypothetical protein
VKWIFEQYASGRSPWNIVTEMLEDLARTTHYEIEKARSIIYGLMGEKKIGLYPIEDRLGRYFMAELAGRQCRIDTPCFLRKNKVGGGGPDRTADSRLMSSSEIISLAKKPQ